MPPRRYNGREPPVELFAVGRPDFQIHPLDQGRHMRRVLTIVVLTMLSAFGFWLSELSVAEDAAKTTPVPTLESLFAGEMEIIDLTYPLNAESPYWPADDYIPFSLKTIATLKNDGVLSKAFTSPEHLGTHIDAPNHFEPNQPSVDQIPVKQFFAPGVVIDISPQAEVDADYRMSVADITDWEKEHGKIPEKAIVMAKTGWGRFWKNFARYKNQDVRGGLHFPGFSDEAAKFLVKQRKIRGIGIDTLSIDHGPSKDFAVHHTINGAGKYALENVAYLDKLPARGFYLVIAPIKIETGSGGPTRIFAILPPGTSESE
jgi:kynurenine formamidase